MTTGMTLKQYHKQRFFQLVDMKKALDMSTAEGRHAFIVLSVQIHVAKGNVPKSYWKFAR